MTTTKITLDLHHILDEAENEIELLSYFVKLYMLDYKIPVIINPRKLNTDPFEVEYGTLTWSVDDKLKMDIVYEY